MYTFNIPSLSFFSTNSRWVSELSLCSLSVTLEESLVQGPKIVSCCNCYSYLLLMIFSGQKYFFAMKWVWRLRTWNDAKFSRVQHLKSSFSNEICKGLSKPWSAIWNVPEQVWAAVNNMYTGHCPAWHGQARLSFLTCLAHRTARADTQGPTNYRINWQSTNPLKPWQHFSSLDLNHTCG